MSAWTKEQIAQIPDVYRDFLLRLKPVLDSRQAPVQIQAIPFSRIVGELGSRYAYSLGGFEKVEHVLEAEGYVTKDGLGFVRPTAKGEDLIQALAGVGDSAAEEVPPFPRL
jgi:hypothetical protein